MTIEEGTSIGAIFTPINLTLQALVALLEIGIGFARHFPGGDSFISLVILTSTRDIHLQNKLRKRTNHGEKSLD